MKSSNKSIKKISPAAVAPAVAAEVVAVAAVRPHRLVDCFLLALLRVPRPHKPPLKNSQKLPGGGDVE